MYKFKVASLREDIRTFLNDPLDRFKHSRDGNQESTFNNKYDVFSETYSAIILSDNDNGLFKGNLIRIKEAKGTAKRIFRSYYILDWSMPWVSLDLKASWINYVLITEIWCQNSALKV